MKEIYSQRRDGLAYCLAISRRRGGGGGKPSNGKTQYKKALQRLPQILARSNCFEPVVQLRECGVVESQERIVFADERSVILFRV